MSVTNKWVVNGDIQGASSSINIVVHPTTSGKQLLLACLPQNQQEFHSSLQYLVVVNIKTAECLFDFKDFLHSPMKIIVQVQRG